MCGRKLSNLRIRIYVLMYLRVFSVKMKKSELLKRTLLCFSNNCLRENPDKCHHRISKKKFSEKLSALWGV